MASVEKVLEDLELLRLPCLQVFNKADLVEPELLQGLKRRLEGIFVSALKAETLIPLIEKMEQMVRHRDEFPLNG